MCRQGNIDGRSEEFGGAQQYQQLTMLSKLQVNRSVYIQNNGNDIFGMIAGLVRLEQSKFNQVVITEVRLWVILYRRLQKNAEQKQSIFRGHKIRHLKIDVKKKVGVQTTGWKNRKKLERKIFPKKTKMSKIKEKTKSLKPEK